MLILDQYFKGEKGFPAQYFKQEIVVPAQNYKGEMEVPAQNLKEGNGDSCPVHQRENQGSWPIC